MGADTGADAGFMAFYCPAQLSLSNRLSPEQGDTAELLGMAWRAAGAIKNTSKSDTREKSVSDKESNILVTICKAIPLCRWSC